MQSLGWPWRGKSGSTRFRTSTCKVQNRCPSAQAAQAGLTTRSQAGRRSQATIAGDMHPVGPPCLVGALRIVKANGHLVQAPSALRRVDGPLRAVPLMILERSEVQTIQRHPPLDLLGSFLDRLLLDIYRSDRAPAGIPYMDKAHRDSRHTSALSTHALRFMLRW